MQGKEHKVTDLAAVAAGCSDSYQKGRGGKEIMPSARVKGAVGKGEMNYLAKRHQPCVETGHKI